MANPFSAQLEINQQELNKNKEYNTLKGQAFANTVAYADDAIKAVANGIGAVEQAKINNDKNYYRDALKTIENEVISDSSITDEDKINEYNTRATDLLNSEAKNKGILYRTFFQDAKNGLLSEANDSFRATFAEHLADESEQQFNTFYDSVIKGNYDANDMASLEYKRVGFDNGQFVVKSSNVDDTITLDIPESDDPIINDFYQNVVNPIYKARCLYQSQPDAKAWLDSNFDTIADDYWMNSYDAKIESAIAESNSETVYEDMLQYKITATTLNPLTGNTSENWEKINNHIDSVITAVREQRSVDAYDYMNTTVTDYLNGTGDFEGQGTHYDITTEDAITQFGSREGLLNWLRDLDYYHGDKSSSYNYGTMVKQILFNNDQNSANNRFISTGDYTELAGNTLAKFNINSSRYTVGQLYEMNKVGTQNLIEQENTQKIAQVEFKTKQKLTDYNLLLSNGALTPVTTDNEVSRAVCGNIVDTIATMITGAGFGLPEIKFEEGMNEYEKSYWTAISYASALVSVDSQYQKELEGLTGNDRAIKINELATNYVNSLFGASMVDYKNGLKSDYEAQAGSISTSSGPNNSVSTKSFDSLVKENNEETVTAITYNAQTGSEEEHTTLDSSADLEAFYISILNGDPVDSAKSMLCAQNNTSVNNIKLIEGLEWDNIVTAFTHDTTLAKTIVDGANGLNYADKNAYLYTCLQAISNTTNGKYGESISKASQDFILLYTKDVVDSMYSGDKFDFAGNIWFIKTNEFDNGYKKSVNNAKNNHFNGTNNKNGVSYMVSEMYFGNNTDNTEDVTSLINSINNFGSDSNEAYRQSLIMAYQTLFGKSDSDWFYDEQYITDKAFAEEFNNLPLSRQQLNRIVTIQGEILAVGESIVRNASTTIGEVDVVNENGETEKQFELQKTNSLIGGVENSSDYISGKSNGKTVNGLSITEEKDSKGKVITYAYPTSDYNNLPRTSVNRLQDKNSYSETFSRDINIFLYEKQKKVLVDDGIAGERSIIPVLQACEFGGNKLNEDEEFVEMWRVPIFEATGVDIEDKNYQREFKNFFASQITETDYWKNTIEPEKEWWKTLVKCYGYKGDVPVVHINYDTSNDRFNYSPIITITYEENAEPYSVVYDF